MKRPRITRHNGNWIVLAHLDSPRALVSLAFAFCMKRNDDYEAWVFYER